MLTSFCQSRRIIILSIRRCPNPEGSRFCLSEGSYFADLEGSYFVNPKGSCFFASFEGSYFGGVLVFDNQEVMFCQSGRNPNRKSPEIFFSYKRKRSDPNTNVNGNKTLSE